MCVCVCVCVCVRVSFTSLFIHTLDSEVNKTPQVTGGGGGGGGRER